MSDPEGLRHEACWTQGLPVTKQGLGVVVSGQRVRGSSLHGVGREGERGQAGDTQNWGRLCELCVIWSKALTSAWGMEQQSLALGSGGPDKAPQQVTAGIQRVAGLAGHAWLLLGTEWACLLLTATVPVRRRLDWAEAARCWLSGLCLQL